MHVLEKQVVGFFFYWDSVIKSWSKDIYFKLLINDFFTAPIRHFGTVKFTFICYRYVDQNQFVQPILFKGKNTIKWQWHLLLEKKNMFHENQIKIIKCLSSTVKPFACRRRGGGIRRLSILHIMFYQMWCYFLNFWAFPAEDGKTHEMY